MSYRLIVVSSGNNPALRALPEQFDENVEVKVFDTANDALWEVRSNPPEAVIADVDLPGMSGLEFAEILPNFDVPTRLVLWSQTSTPAVRQQADEYGVYSLLQSSTSMEDLRTTLIEAMQAGASGTAIEEGQTPETVEVTEAPAPEPPLEPAAQTAPETKRFTPARIRLPSRNERARKPAQADVASQEPASPSHPAPAPTAPKRQRGGTLVLTEDKFAPIRTIMSQLSQELGAQCTLLTDRAGLVLAEDGSTADLPTMVLLPLLSTSFSTAGEIARQLHEEDATNLYIHEGHNYDIYCFNILQQYLLVLIFNKKVASSKIGAVWVNAKRSIRELREKLG